MHLDSALHLGTPMAGWAEVQSQGHPIGWE